MDLGGMAMCWRREAWREGVVGWCAQNELLHELVGGLLFLPSHFVVFIGEGRFAA